MMMADQVQNDDESPSTVMEHQSVKKEEPQSVIAHRVNQPHACQSPKNWYRLIVVAVLLFIGLCTFMVLYFVELKENGKVDEKAAAVNSGRNPADGDDTTESPTQSPTEEKDPIEQPSNNPFHGISPKQARLYSAIAPAVASSPYFYMANQTLNSSSRSEYMAWKWLSEDDDYFSYSDNLESTPDWKIVERYAVTVFYFAMNGEGWTNQYNFLSNSSVCDWHDIHSTFHYGVRFCSDQGSVTMLQLPFNNLEGSLPASAMVILSNLSSLDLPNNLIQGTIPSEISKLSALSGRLDLSFNRLTGSIPESIVDSLTNLRELLLQYNQLDGKIPNEIVSMTSLTSMNLGSNRLTGSIPENIGHDLTLLQNLRLNDNLLTGKLPSSIGMLDRLHQLQLQQNQLTGDIPTSLLNLQNHDAHTFNLYLHANSFADASMEFLCQDNAVCQTRMGCSSDCLDTVECSCCRKCYASEVSMCAKVSPSRDGCRMIMDDNLNKLSSVIEAKNPVDDSSNSYLLYDTTDFAFVVTDKINIDSEDSAYSVYGSIPVNGGPITYNPKIGVPDVTCQELMTDDWYAMRDDSQLRFMEVPGYPCTEFGKRIIYRLIMEWLYFG